MNPTLVVLWLEAKPDQSWKTDWRAVWFTKHVQRQMQCHISGYDIGRQGDTCTLTLRRLDYKERAIVKHCTIQISLDRFMALLQNNAPYDRLTLNVGHRITL